MAEHGDLFALFEEPRDISGVDSKAIRRNMRGAPMPAQVRGNPPPWPAGLDNRQHRRPDGGVGAEAVQ